MATYRGGAVPGFLDGVVPIPSFRHNQVSDSNDIPTPAPFFFANNLFSKTGQPHDVIINVHPPDRTPFRKLSSFDVDVRQTSSSAHPSGNSECHLDVDYHRAKDTYSVGTRLFIKLIYRPVSPILIIRDHVRRSHHAAVGEAHRQRSACRQKASQPCHQRSHQCRKDSQQEYQGIFDLFSVIISSSAYALDGRAQKSNVGCRQGTT